MRRPPRTFLYRTCLPSPRQGQPGRCNVRIAQDTPPTRGPRHFSRRTTPTGPGSNGSTYILPRGNFATTGRCDRSARSAAGQRAIRSPEMARITSPSDQGSKARGARPKSFKEAIALMSVSCPPPANLKIVSSETQSSAASPCCFWNIPMQVAKLPGICCATRATDVSRPSPANHICRCVISSVRARTRGRANPSLERMKAARRLPIAR
jgi:hypothetical protein